MLEFTAAANEVPEGSTVNVPLVEKFNSSNSSKSSEINWMLEEEEVTAVPVFEPKNAFWVVEVRDPLSNPEAPVFTTIGPDAASTLSAPGLILYPSLVPAVDPIVVKLIPPD